MIVTVCCKVKVIKYSRHQKVIVLVCVGIAKNVLVCLVQKFIVLVCVFRLVLVVMHLCIYVNVVVVVNGLLSA